jgi:alkanesulfonate monooxygenase SsuD/methylene tetrahydromethanopterin reductase-like flavin-dependent oxidoreductase (luciferase family)
LGSRIQRLRVIFVFKCPVKLNLLDESGARHRLNVDVYPGLDGHVGGDLASHCSRPQSAWIGCEYPHDGGQFRLGVEPPGEVPIYVAADKLKTLRLAGEIADGVLLTWGALDAVPQVVAEIRAGTEGTAATPTTSTWRCICAPV